MNYKEMVKIIAKDGNEVAKGNIIAREMCHLIDSILDYNYAVDNYIGDGTVIEDKRNQIKNKIALVVTDLDIYMEQLGLTEGVEKKTIKRLEKLTKRVTERN